MLQLLEDAMTVEIESRTNHRIHSLLRRAHLLHTHAHLDQIAYFPERNIDHDLLDRLETGGFIENNKNVCIYGASGTGKSFLGKALGVCACQLGYRTRYIRFSQLMRELVQLELNEPKKYEKRLRFYSRIPVLIIDEWLLGAKKQGVSQILLELMELRYRETSTIFCTQIEPDGWPMAVSIQALGESVLGRSMSKSYVLHLKGPDLRKTFPEKP
jgi:DNA replication protein DnaC